MTGFNLFYTKQNKYC